MPSMKTIFFLNIHRTEFLLIYIKQTYYYFNSWLKRLHFKIENNIKPQINGKSEASWRTIYSYQHDEIKGDSLRTACDIFGRDENVLIMSVERPEKMRLLGHASIDWKIVLNVSSVCSLLALACNKSTQFRACFIICSRKSPLNHLVS